MAGERPVAPGGDHVPRYRVAAVERMTRIPASTLRSWERRYGWPRPSRADSGQRLYSDHDLAVIRFLDRRRLEGMSMSQATGLLHAAPAVDDHDPARLLARLVESFRAFDEAGAEQAFAAAEALLGVEGVAVGVVPAAIAAAATDGHGPGPDGMPVEVEHFAANFLRRQVLRLLDGLPPAMGRPVLVGCGPDEQHELGALVLTLLLRARGYRVVYLGARVPGPAMERAVAWTRDSRRWSRRAPAWWGGPAVVDAPDLAANLPGALLDGSVEQGATTVDATLARRR